MAGRIIAIGDIHGCLAALEAVLAAIVPRPEDTVVTLGDYVDRGPDSPGVIERLIALGAAGSLPARAATALADKPPVAPAPADKPLVAPACRLIPLLGNHDQMFLWICDGRLDLIGDWRLFGGDTTLASYGGLVPGGVPPHHLDFLRRCRLFFETDRHIFVHGNYQADLPLEQQAPEVLLWDSVKRRQPGPHCSGKTAIIGHSAQKLGEILDLGYLKCIDTCCYGDGWLTALDVETGQVWQADKKGRMRG